MTLLNQTYQKIDTLLERFYAGELSGSGEQELHDLLLHTSPLPERLERERDFFLLLEGEMQREVEEIVVPTELEQKLRRQLRTQAAESRRGLLLRRGLLKWLTAGAAAAVIAAIAISLLNTDTLTPNLPPHSEGGSLATNTPTSAANSRPADPQLTPTETSEPNVTESRPRVETISPYKREKDSSQPVPMLAMASTSLTPATESVPAPIYPLSDSPSTINSFPSTLANTLTAPSVKLDVKVPNPAVPTEESHSLALLNEQLAYARTSGNRTVSELNRAISEDINNLSEGISESLTEVFRREPIDIFGRHTECTDCAIPNPE